MNTDNSGECGSKGNDRNNGNFYKKGNHGNQKINGNIINDDNHSTNLSITTTQTLLTSVTKAAIMLLTKVVIKVAGLHVKCLLFSSSINQTLIFSTDFSNNPHCVNVHRNPSSRSWLIHMDNRYLAGRQADIFNIILILQPCKHAYK